MWQLPPACDRIQQWTAVVGTLHDTLPGLLRDAAAGVRDQLAAFLRETSADYAAAGVLCAMGPALLHRVTWGLLPGIDSFMVQGMPPRVPNNPGGGWEVGRSRLVRSPLRPELRLRVTILVGPQPAQPRAAQPMDPNLPSMNDMAPLKEN